MRNFMRLATGANVAPLMLAIARRPELWTEDTFLRNYPQGPFGEVESIMLRFPVVATGLTEKQIALYKKNKLAGYDQHESVDQPAYARLHEARALVMSVFSAVAGERLGRVMINKIAPGGHIFPHADTPNTPTTTAASMSSCRARRASNSAAATRRPTGRLVRCSGSTTSSSTRSGTTARPTAST